MSQTMPPPGPPDGFDRDVALSALLDGELAAFANDHGLIEDQARAQLDAWPELAARRATLEASREVMHAPVAPLDHLTRRRLVRTAVQALPGADEPRPRSRVLVAIGGVAAGLLLIVGIGLAFNSSGDRGSSSDASGSAPASADLHGDLGDLGDVTNAAVLRAILDDGATGAGGSTTSSPTERAAQAPSTGSAKDSRLLPDAKSTKQCAQQLAGKRRVAFVGSGTYQGTPVTIVGLRVQGRTIAVVVPNTDCTNVLASVSR